MSLVHSKRSLRRAVCALAACAVLKCNLSFAQTLHPFGVRSRWGEGQDKYFARCPVDIVLNRRVGIAWRSSKARSQCRLLRARG